MRSSKMPVPDLVVILRRMGDEPRWIEYDRQHVMDERSARRAAATGNAARSGDTVSTASGI
jgi:hypothetical protein